MPHSLTDVVERVKQRHSHAAVPRCAEHGCRLGLAGLGRHVVLKGEAACPQGSRAPDCLVFVVQGDRLSVAVVELKSRTVDVSAVEEKLQNGASRAVEIAHECGCDSVDLRCLVLSKALDSSEFRVLTGKPRIRLQGASHRIQPRKCGVALKDVLRST